MTSMNMIIQKIFVTLTVFIERRYFNRPAEELIFVENEKVHRSLPHKGSLNRVKKCSKKVICVETGVVYTSIAEAARVNNLFENHIGRCCNGKQGTTGGFHWEYLPLE